MKKMNYSLPMSMEDIDARHEELRAQLGAEVFCIAVPSGEQSDPTLLHACYLRRPDRKVLKNVMHVAKSDEIMAAEIVLRDCWIEGDARIQTDDTLFMKAMQVVAPIMDYSGAELKKK